MMMDNRTVSNCRFGINPKLLMYLSPIFIASSIAIYIISPSYYYQHLLPGNILWNGQTNTDNSALGAIFLAIAIFIVVSRYGKLVPENKSSSPASAVPLFFRISHKAIWFSVTILLSVSAVLLYESFNSYFMISTDQIIYRLGVFQPIETFGWKDVAVASARCGATKSGPFTEIQFKLKNGFVLPISLVNSGKKDQIYIIQRLLSGHPYQYSAASSVTPTTCPPGDYDLLTNWKF